MNRVAALTARLLCLFPLFARSSSAEGLVIQHHAVGCVVHDEFWRLEAQVEPLPQVSRVRVYFKATASLFWYFVEMAPQAGTFAATLPKANSSTRNIDYYVEVVDRGFVATRTTEHRPDVVGPGGCTKDQPLATIVTTARVVVTAVGGGPAIPLGFSVVGIVPGTAAAGGAVAAGATVGTAGTVGGGVSTGVVAASAVAAGAAVTAVAVAGGGAEETPAPTVTPVPTPAPSPPVATPAPSVPTPTPSPAPAPTAAPTASGVSGRWVGTAPEGILTTMNAICDVEQDLFLDLVESGGMVTGSGRSVIRRNVANAPAPCDPVGAMRGPFSIAGQAPAGTFTFSVPLQMGLSATFSGMVSGTKMSGTWNCNGCPPSGTWAVSRQP
jgi:hypothetical protein